MEDDLNGRQPQWKMTTLACLASQLCSELGPAQPQLFFLFFYEVLTIFLWLLSHTFVKLITTLTELLKRLPQKH